MRGWRSSRRYHDSGRLNARGAAGERHQRDITSAFDGHAEPALMPRADTGHAARENLAALLHELRQNVRALVVDKIHLLDAKLADFLLAKILPFAPSRPAWPTARSTFPARSAMSPSGAPVTSGTAFASSPNRAARSL